MAPRACAARTTAAETSPWCSASTSAPSSARAAAAPARASPAAPPPRRAATTTRGHGTFADAVAVLGVADRRAARSGASLGERRRRRRVVVRRDERPLLEPVRAHARDDVPLDPGRLHVDLDADRRVARGTRARRRGGGPSRARASMAEQQAGADVELHGVRAGLDRRRERLDRVLGRERRGAAVADHERAAVAAAHDHGRARRTIASSRGAVRCRTSSGSRARRSARRRR